jgi:hypothetical protein
MADYIFYLNVNFFVPRNLEFLFKGEPIVLSNIMLELYVRSSIELIDESLLVVLNYKNY